MTVTLRSQMPAVYRGWLPGLFDRPMLEESRATCADCAMCDKGGAPGGLRAGFFRPEVKCCSYHPTLPNYLVGAALRDTSPDLASGRTRLRQKIAARVGVTAVWLAAPRKYLVLYDAARESSFGRSESLLCPYFDRGAGNCSIWPYRESVCATFFCKHGSGASGHAFWRALKRYLSHVETSLARHAATTLRGSEPPPDLPRTKLTREDLEDRPPTDADYASHWGDWIGREEEFYVGCAALVEGLDEAAIARVVGRSGGDELLRDATTRYDVVANPKIHARLTLNPALAVTPAEAGGGVGVTSYSAYDPLFLTQDLYDALKEFSGKELVTEVLARLRRDHDVELPESLLLEMQVFGVMTEATPPTPPDAPASPSG
jgi:Fe-S-cluster containining protein